MGRTDRTHTQREIFLATILNHPHLLDSVEETFAQLIFSGELDRMHGAILQAFHQEGPLTQDKLRGILEQQGLADLAKTLIHQVYLHAPFVRSDVPEAEVRTSWDSLWSLYQTGLGRGQQAQELRQRLEEDWDTETWEKLKRLQEDQQMVHDF